MDRHSEVEIKFKADKVTLKQFHKLVTNQSAEFLTSDAAVRITGYKAVHGTDTYYDLHGQTLRLRADGSGERIELTYKQRKSKASIADRVEINLRFARETSDTDVAAMLRYLGAEELFSITKDSYIYHVTGRVGDQVYDATLALYDVEAQDTSTSTRRFLEVEIESSSTCSPEEGLKALDRWKRIVRKELSVKGPLNESLFEIYSNKGNK